MSQNVLLKCSIYGMIINHSVKCVSNISDTDTFVVDMLNNDSNIYNKFLSVCDGMLCIQRGALYPESGGLLI